MARAEPAPPPAGVYLHLPFCARICPYCDFAVTVGRPSERRRLVDAMRREIETRAEEVPGTVDTIYCGGGTPSLIEPADLAGLVEALRSHLPIAPGCGISLEANPEDVSPAAVEAWRQIGVTTLSLGVQSLEVVALDFLGRAHTPGDVARALEIARLGEFETVSLDLIYGRPGQRVDAWRRELRAAAALEPDHVSCYQLTVNASTPFGRRVARGDLVELGESRQAEMFLATHETLGALGWTCYEVSNFARARRHRSRHNLKYWRGAPYLGFGPSAHSFVAPTRSWNVGARAYVERIESDVTVVAGCETLTAGEQLLEAVMLGMRTTAGIDLSALERRFGVDLWQRNRQRLERWQRAGWMMAEAGRVRATPAGMAVADHLTTTLELPAAATDRVIA